MAGLNIDDITPKNLGIDPEPCSPDKETQNWQRLRQVLNPIIERLKEIGEGGEGGGDGMDTVTPIFYGRTTDEPATGDSGCVEVPVTLHTGCGGGGTPVAAVTVILPAVRGRRTHLPVGSIIACAPRDSLPSDYDADDIEEAAPFVAVSDYSDDGMYWFTLEAPLAPGGSASAIIYWLNGGEKVGFGSVTVHDESTEEQFFRGGIGYGGWCTPWAHSEDHYSIVWMEHPASDIDFELTEDMSLLSAPANVLFYFNGHNPGVEVIVTDVGNRWPDALAGAHGKARYNINADIYEIYVCEQETERAVAVLGEDLLETDETVEVTGFAVKGQPELMQIPGVVPEEVYNPLHLFGYAGQVVYLQRFLYGEDKTWNIVSLAPERFWQFKRFKLTADLELGGSATAVLRVWNGTAYIDQPEDEEIIVHDWWSESNGGIVSGTSDGTIGMWQGKATFEGWCRKRELPNAIELEPGDEGYPGTRYEDNHYDIVWMETFAWSGEGTALADIDKSEEPWRLSLQTNEFFEQGLPPQTTITVYDDQQMFPYLLESAKVKLQRSEHKRDDNDTEEDEDDDTDIQPYHKIINAQQMCFLATAKLGAPMCSKADASIYGFAPATFSPFNLPPSTTPSTARNPRDHRGEANDDVVVMWNENSLNADDEIEPDWEVIDVTKHQELLVTNVSFDGECFYQQKKYYSVERCGSTPPDPEQIVCGVEC